MRAVLMFLVLFRSDHEIEGIFFESKMLFEVYAGVEIVGRFLGMFFALPGVKQIPSNPCRLQRRP